LYSLDPVNNKPRFIILIKIFTLIIGVTLISK